MEEDLKKANLWRQDIGAGNNTQGSKVRQTIRLNSSDRFMEIRKTRFNSLGVLYKGKRTRLFYAGLFANSNCLVYKSVKP